MQTCGNVAKPRRIGANGNSMLDAPTHFGRGSDPRRADPGEEPEGGGAMLPSKDVRRQGDDDPPNRSGIMTSVGHHLIDLVGQGRTRVRHGGTNISPSPLRFQPGDTAHDDVIAEQVQGVGQIQLAGVGSSA
ncbi:hypothetical protein Lesp02_30910 [Lentzea sp. NBRC 105346]|nr:hypothetical protein Lesp02_30910 [Lentzea sp. NBRC 105346]